MVFEVLGRLAKQSKLGDYLKGMVEGTIEVSNPQKLFSKGSEKSLMSN